MVSVTITYRQPGTQPPIFVAGSFSDPQWQPLEMDFATEEGEHTFYKNVEVPPSTQIQYKFRVGLGDWWVLNEGADTVTDDSGNRNNILTAPASQHYTEINGSKANGHAAERPDTNTSNMDASEAAAAHSRAQLEPKSKVDHLKDGERQRLSSTPIEQVADTAAEVADTAQKLDRVDEARLVPPKAVQGLKDEERQRLSGTPIEQVANTAAEVADTAQKLDREDEPHLAPPHKGVQGLKDEERQRLSSTPIEQVANTAAEVADTAQKLYREDERYLALHKGVQGLKDEERQRLSSTPIEQVANTAAEVADTAQKLDMDQDLDEEDVADDGPPPLFSHEALGSYEPEASDEEDEAARTSNHGTVDYDVDKYDLNDPTLERLPSSRDAIMDAVRKVETGRNEDQTHFHGAPLSPIVGARKSSLDPYYEEAVVSPGPASPNSFKKLELPRRSHGSMASDRSHVSLGSIAEEENKDSTLDETSGLVRVPSPAMRPSSNTMTSPGSDEDEGVVMKGSSSKTKRFGRPESPDANGNTNSKHSRDLSPKSQPSILIQPPELATDSSSSNESTTSSSAEATGRDDGHSHKGQLKKRGPGAASFSPADRPGTPSSIHSVAADSKGGWMQAFIRVLFVDWIGGIFSRIFGSKRKA
ncbi:hypothetical protein CTRI78_v010465 [Colletotrichum trifolii]|uniref:AMP-activated protein kinase glycogen-binding domain-containing protein n=1 Tax=Colletotrichum trifolii TaxID=5466 RepID=A0A4R8QXP1_COLTR|nr:hypothetical protein CTRI78_v010465 [Colletotrichum trifolii]